MPHFLQNERGNYRKIKKRWGNWFQEYLRLGIQVTFPYPNVCAEAEINTRWEKSNLKFKLQGKGKRCSLKMTYLSGYSAFKRAISSSMVSRDLSEMSSIFSHPITSLLSLPFSFAYRGVTFTTCIQRKFFEQVWDSRFCWGLTGHKSSLPKSKYK